MPIKGLKMPPETQILATRSLIEGLPHWGLSPEQFQYKHTEHSKSSNHWQYRKEWAKRYGSHAF